MHVQLDATTNPDFFPRQLWVLRPKAEDTPDVDEWAGKVKAVVKEVKALEAKIGAKMDVQGATTDEKINVLDAKINAKINALDAKMDAMLAALQLLSQGNDEPEGPEPEPETEPESATAE